MGASPGGPGGQAGRADLHMHTMHSDGEHSARELVRMATSASLVAISLTDHDTLAGWNELVAAADGTDLELVCGVELSGMHRGRDAHVLGYFVDPGKRELKAALEGFAEQRARRADEMVRKLNAVGVPLTRAHVEAAAGTSVVGRPHVADALVSAGLTKNYQEAFRRYIGVGRPGYVPKSRFSAVEAIELIHMAGGLAVLAHPNGTFDESDVESLAAKGLDGVEVHHPRHSADDTRRFSEVAERLGLLRSGGSDFHGASRGEAVLGSPSIPYEWVMRMKERL